MTSTISYTKLRKQYRKQNPGIILITAFFFFIEIILFVMEMQNRVGQSDGMTHAQILNNVIWAVRPNSIMACAVTAIAVISAGSMLFYLHSGKKEDFYESLPIRRETQFILLCENALLIFAVPMVIAEIIQCGIVAAAGFLCRETLLYLVLAAAGYLLIFAAAWLTMALAMIMTGHIVVAGLGFGVFASYFSIVLKEVLSGYAGVFFTTYTTDASGDTFIWESLFPHLSPVWTGVKMTSFVNWRVQDSLQSMAELLVWIAVLFLLCRILYDKRPAEAAGRAMAFPKLNPVIRILLVIPAALAAGLYFYVLSMQGMMIWMIVGIILGAVLFHGIIECIYQFDVRAFFHHKKQLAITMAAVLLILAAFWGDLFGFDRYSPKVSELKSILIEVQESSISGDFWGKTKEGLTGDAMEKALSMIQAAQDQKESGSSTEEDISIDVTYSLKNGKEKHRTYNISTDSARQLYDELYQTRTFKKSLYSLYTADYSTVTKTAITDGIHTETLNFTEEEKKEFFDTYLSEFDSLSWTDTKNTAPAAKLTLTHNTSMYGSNEDTYYIYPDFTRTIAFLAQKDITLQSVKDMNITSLNVVLYEESTDENRTYQITDKKLIAGVKEKMIPEELIESSGYEIPYIGMDIQVNYSTADGNSAVLCSTDEETAQKLE